MTEKTTTPKENKHEDKKEDHAHSHADGHAHEHKHDEKIHDHKAHAEHKPEEKKEIKEKPKVKKDHAVVRAPSVHISKRHGMYICAFIKGKSVDSAISQLEEVIILKRAVPFKGEIPHRKGMMSGRYPVSASKIFIPLLKNLKGAILSNGMDITKARIYSAYTNFAPRPQRRGGTRGKRASVTLEAREIGAKNKMENQAINKARSKNSGNPLAGGSN
jgi:ribosomal protein L22